MKKVVRNTGVCMKYAREKKYRQKLASIISRIFHKPIIIIVFIANRHRFVDFALAGLCVRLR